VRSVDVQHWYLITLTRVCNPKNPKPLLKLARKMPKMARVTNKHADASCLHGRTTETNNARQRLRPQRRSVELQITNARRSSSQTAHVSRVLRTRSRCRSRGSAAASRCIGSGGREGGLGDDSSSSSSSRSTLRWPSLPQVFPYPWMSEMWRGSCVGCYWLCSEYLYVRHDLSRLSACSTNTTPIFCSCCKR
jgi:hypothetical protein